MQTTPKPKLLDQVRNRIRVKHYTHSTEQVYVCWIRRYILFHDKRHPQGMREAEVEQFLTHLAQNERVSASAQNQAFSAILFLYREVLKMPLEKEIKAIKAKSRKRVPVVLDVDEVKAIIDHMQGVPKLMISLIYGSGIRSNECVSLRVRHLDFSSGCIRVMDSKGTRDRLTLLPKGLEEELKSQLEKVKKLHEKDLADGYGETWVPRAIDRKYTNVGSDFRWQFVFPSSQIFHDEKTGNKGRWSVHESMLNKALRKAVQQAGIRKRVGTHTLRHSFATHLLMSGCDIRRVQQLLGHKSVKTTMQYMHIVDLTKANVMSPLDRMMAEPQFSGASISGDGHVAPALLTEP